MAKKKKAEYYRVSWNFEEGGIETKIFPKKKALEVYNALLVVSGLLFITSVSMVKE
jgi:hypothetical protein